MVIVSSHRTKWRVQMNRLNERKTFVPVSFQNEEIALVRGCKDSLVIRVNGLPGEKGPLQVRSSDERKSRMPKKWCRVIFPYQRIRANKKKEKNGTYRYTLPHLFLLRDSNSEGLPALLTFRCDSDDSTSLIGNSAGPGSVGLE